MAEDPPLLHAAIDMPASTNPDMAKIAQRGALYFVLPGVAFMRLLPEVSPQVHAENENRKYNHRQSDTAHDSRSALVSLRPRPFSLQIGVHRWLVVTMAMAVIIVAPVMAMVVIMVVMAPMSFVVSPPFPVVVIMWMRPGCTRVRRLLVASGDPTIVVTLRRPEASYPDHADDGRWRWRRLIRYRWRRNPDINRNLSRCGHRKGHPKKKRDQTFIFHVCPPFNVEPVPSAMGIACRLNTSTADTTDAAPIAQWRFSGIARTTSSTDLEERHSQAVGGEARPLITKVAGTHGRSVEWMIVC